MPSSLTGFLSRTLVYSTFPPVSVYGTDTITSTFRSFSCQHSINTPASSVDSTVDRVSVLCTADFPTIQPAPFNTVIQHCAYLAYWTPPSLNDSSTGILTSGPSTTPFGLALGSDLPREDELYPGNLGISVTEILTLFFATHACMVTTLLSRVSYLPPSTCKVRSPTIVSKYNPRLRF